VHVGAGTCSEHKHASGCTCARCSVAGKD
jgi:hypothetical protein